MMLKGDELIALCDDAYCLDTIMPSLLSNIQNCLHVSMAI